MSVAAPMENAESATTPPKDSKVSLSQSRKQQLRRRKAARSTPVVLEDPTPVISSLVVLEDLSPVILEDPTPMVPSPVVLEDLTSVVSSPVVLEDPSPEVPSPAVLEDLSLVVLEDPTSVVPSLVVLEDLTSEVPSPVVLEDRLLRSLVRWSWRTRLLWS